MTTDQLGLGVPPGQECCCGGQWPFRAGLPQGSVLASTLNKLWSTDLIADLKSVPGTDIFTYADDKAALGSGKSIEQAGQWAQRAADVISSWAKRWRMRIFGGEDASNRPIPVDL